MIKRLVLLKIQNIIDIKEVLLQWVINCLIKKTSSGAIKNEVVSNKELAEGLNVLIVRKFK